MFQVVGCASLCPPYGLLMRFSAPPTRAYVPPPQAYNAPPSYAPNGYAPQSDVPQQGYAAGGPAPVQAQSLPPPR